MLVIAKIKVILRMIGCKNILMFLLDAIEVIVSIEVCREISWVLIVINNLNCEEKFKHWTRESEYNYHNGVTQGSYHNNSKYFSWSY